MEMTPLLHLLFKKSFATGNILEDWRMQMAELHSLQPQAGLPDISLLQDSGAYHCPRHPIRSAAWF